MRRQFEERLANAERRIYALNKERDALQRGSAQAHDKDDVIKEKDAIIEEVWNLNNPKLHPATRIRYTPYLQSDRPVVGISPTVFSCIKPSTLFESLLGSLGAL